MPKPRRLALLTEPRIQLFVPSPRQPAPGTRTAGSLKVEYSHPISYLPAPGASKSNSSDDPGGLVRRDHGELGGELALQDLEVRVAEARGVDADEELVIFDLGYRAVLQLV